MWDGMLFFSYGGNPSIFFGESWTKEPGGLQSEDHKVGLSG